MTIFQTTSNFTRIASILGGNSYGGPGFRQLEAIVMLSESEGSAVLSEFADEVHFNMSPEERKAVAEGVARALTQRSACA